MKDPRKIPIDMDERKFILGCIEHFKEHLIGMDEAQDLDTALRELAALANDCDLVGQSLTSHLREKARSRAIQN